MRYRACASCAALLCSNHRTNKRSNLGWIEPLHDCQHGARHLACTAPPCCVCMQCWDRESSIRGRPSPKVSVLVSARAVLLIMPLVCGSWSQGRAQLPIRPLRLPAVRLGGPCGHDLLPAPQRPSSSHLWVILWCAQVAGMEVVGGEGITHKRNPVMWQQR